MRLILFCFAFFYSFSLSAQALKIPRFVSLRSDTVYMRAGPGERFPIEWIYKKKNFPVQIIDSFEHWRKVEDVDGTQGWIHKKMLSGKRTALTAKNRKTIMYSKKSLSAKPLFFFEGQSIVQVLKCSASDIFCQVKYDEKKGFILKENLFGVYLDEEIDE
jgi:SH3-like domain-containing protein